MPSSPDRDHHEHRNANPANEGKARGKLKPNIGPGHATLFGHLGLPARTDVAQRNDLQYSCALAAQVV